MDAELLWDIIRRLVGHLMQQDNARLALNCLALASSAALLGDSMTAVGRKHGLSRAAVSKRCIERLLKRSPVRVHEEKGDLAFGNRAAEACSHVPRRLR